MGDGDAEGAAADGRSTASHSPPRDQFRAESHVYLLVKGKRETSEGGKRERKQGTDSNSNTRARRHSPLERNLPLPAVSGHGRNFPCRCSSDPSQRVRGTGLSALAARRRLLFFLCRPGWCRCSGSLAVTARGHHRIRTTSHCIRRGEENAGGPRMHLAIRDLLFHRQAEFATQALGSVIRVPRVADALG